MNVPKLRFKEFTDEWQKKTLKSVSSYFKSGKSIKSSDILEKGLYPVYGGNGLRGYTNTFNFDGNASLIGRQGALCGNVTYVKGKNYMTEHAVIVQSNHDNYNKFLFYILFSMNLNQYSTQSAQPGLSVSNLLALFNYFPNIKEQTKIANFLSTVDKKISNLEDIIINLEKQKKGLLQQIFSQKIRFKDKNGNNYPDWEKKKLSELCFKIGDGLHATPKYIDSGTNYFINGNNLLNKKIIVNELTKKVSTNELSKYYISLGNNSILISINGTIGNLAFYNNENIILGKSCGYINLKDDVIKDFIHYYLLQSKIQLYFHKELTGTTIKNLSLVSLKNTPIKLPCLEEQTKIADFLSAFDRKIDNQKAQLEHWKQIKKGLLQQMFV